MEPTLPWALSPVPETSFLPELQGSWFQGGQSSMSQKAPAGGHFPKRLGDKGIRKVLPSGNRKGVAKRGGTHILEKVVLSLQFQAHRLIPYLTFSSLDNKSSVIWRWSWTSIAQIPGGGRGQPSSIGRGRGSIFLQPGLTVPSPQSWMHSLAL